ncbi:MAG: sugar transferase [Okeania sp. SIO2C2]|uniref:sugar transferase n=1 Tax=Okeania sp. SIO2C2 TaxID=2607787 RepID=UPI0013B8F342|nr:sugar transferase [Okeania sp. SIO2C2]
MNTSNLSVSSNMNSLAVLEHKYSTNLYKQVAHPSVNSPSKRLIDILGALVGLAITGVFAIPVLISMQFDSPGPLFFSQVRCGYQGKTFWIRKFRSMVVDAEKLKHLVKNEAKGNIFKNEKDPRITRIGRFLRRTSLDELPQFWNVLKGDMSLVGTRPPTFDEVKNYEAHHWHRLDIKPGMTGEWQVNGRSSVKDFEEIVCMDIDYQQKWSIAYDLKLIWKTIWVVFNKSGAC